MFFLFYHTLWPVLQYTLGDSLHCVFIHPFNHPFIYLSIHPSTHSNKCLFIYYLAKQLRAYYMSDTLDLEKHNRLPVLSVLELLAIKCKTFVDWYQEKNSAKEEQNRDLWVISTSEETAPAQRKASDIISASPQSLELRPKPERWIPWQELIAEECRLECCRGPSYRAELPGTCLWPHLSTTRKRFLFSLRKSFPH